MLPAIQAEKPEAEAGDAPKFFKLLIDSLPPGGRSLDTLAVRKAWGEWVKDRAERRHPLTSRAVGVQAAHVAKSLPVSPDELVAAIDRAIGNGWRMFWIDKTDGRTGSKATLGRGQSKSRIHRGQGEGRYDIPG
jgi:hypothetical protein